MKKEELQHRIDEIKWFHRIDLPTDEGEVLTTPGVLTAEHCSEEAATHRFGIPEDLSGLRVLDVGAHQGYFSFLAHKRGAKVTAVEPNQGDGDNIKGFELANEVLGCKISLNKSNLRHYNICLPERKYDVVFYFGVLYHVTAPIDELKYLSQVTKEGGYALIETAISHSIKMGESFIPVWQLKPGHDNDPTNYWYPSIEGLESALSIVGFKRVDILYVTSGGERVTVRAYK